MLHIWEHQNNIWWIMRLMMHFRSYSLTAGGPRKICTFVCTFELGYCRTLHITEALPLALAKRINGLNTAKDSAFHPCQHGFLVIFVSPSGVTSGKMSRLRISTAYEQWPRAPCVFQFLTDKIWWKNVNGSWGLAGGKPHVWGIRLAVTSMISCWHLSNEKSPGCLGMFRVHLGLYYPFTLGLW